MISLLLIMVGGFAHAQGAGLSMVQDELGIVCQRKDRPKWRLSVERKDKELRIVSGDSDVPIVYESQGFMESGVIFKTAVGNQVVLFHILENQKVIALLGTAEDYSEAECLDTGNSKTCKNTGGNELFWSPEKLSFKRPAPATETTALKMWRYGIFPNDATYFYARENGDTALALVDFGAKFKVITGVIHDLSCQYDK